MTYLVPTNSHDVNISKYGGKALRVLNSNTVQQAIPARMSKCGSIIIYTFYTAVVLHN